MRPLARLTILAAVLLGLAVAQPAAGQETPAAADGPITADDLARLSDAELRRIVLDRLAEPDAQPRAHFNPANTAYALQAASTRVRDRLGAILAAYDALPPALARGLVRLFGDRSLGALGGFGLVFAISLVAGWLIERLVRRGRRAPVEAIAPAPTPTLSRKAGIVLADLTGRLFAIAVFAVAATVVFFVLHDGHSHDRIAFAFYLAAVILIRLIGGVSRAYLAVDRPALRIPAYTDDEARHLYTAILAAIALGAFGFFTCALFATLGVAGDAHLLFLILVGTITSLGLSAVFVVGRRALAGDLALDGTGGAMRRRLARSYPWAMAGGTLVLWAGLVVATLLGAPPLFGAGLATVALLVLWPSLDAAALREAVRTAAAGAQATPALLGLVRVGLAVAVLLVLAVAWRVDLTGSAGLGSAITRSLLEVAVVLLIAHAAWQALKIWIDRKIAEEDAARGDLGEDLGEMEIGGTGLSRMRTLLPLFKRAGQATIASIALMIVLSALGVNIGPVLAGAGVVGIAIGFGSQTLVRDIVSGAFFLMDDAFRLGEYIDLGSVKGSVERISLRSLQLRHHRGALNTVPFGEIQTLTNYSRDWAIMKLRFRVPFDTDIEKARKIIKAVGKDLLSHPEVGADFLAPFKSQGVVEVDDYGLVISTKFMCKPGRQFLIRRHAYAAVQRAFAENDIQFARPEIRVAVSRGAATEAEANEEDLQAAGAALLAKTPAPGTAPPRTGTAGAE